MTVSTTYKQPRRLHCLMLLMVMVLNPLAAMAMTESHSAMGHGQLVTSHPVQHQLVEHPMVEHHMAEHHMNGTAHQKCCDEFDSCSQGGCHPTLAVIQGAPLTAVTASALSHPAPIDYLNPSLGLLTPPPNF